MSLSKLKEERERGREGERENLQMNRFRIRSEKINVTTEISNIHKVIGTIAPNYMPTN